MYIYCNLVNRNWYVTCVQWKWMWCVSVVYSTVPCEEPVLQVVRVSTVLGWNVDCQCPRNKGDGDWGPCVHLVATLLVSSEDIHSLHWWQHSSVTVIILCISMWHQHDSQCSWHRCDVQWHLQKTDMWLSRNYDVDVYVRSDGILYTYIPGQECRHICRNCSLCQRKGTRRRQLCQWLPQKWQLMLHLEKQCKSRSSGSHLQPQQWFQRHELQTMQHLKTLMYLQQRKTDLVWEERGVRMREEERRW